MAVYTHGHHESVLRSHRWRTAANSAAYLLPHLTPGARLLDVGCGPGTITADLAERVAAVTAVETAPAALDAARAVAADRGLAVDFAVEDVHALSFADDTFDVVHAHQVLQHVADPVAALREMARVCRPGGVVAARDSDYAAFAWWPEVPALAEWRDLYRRVARANGGEPDAGRRLLSWARAAGLDATATASAWCFATPADRAWWGGMWADRVVGSALGERAVALGLADLSDLRRLADGWREWAAADDGWFLVPHGEILVRSVAT
ncbi:methyltransferase domain-containing protein [Asanoa sp. WMMD1127]|uniref:class I SAM-dependent methyltransferase n=1 Tax=Asanoa sp. WMMD1127 TaxID=3016107 RepID=UPI002417D4A4|nr:methyltransferase domain-containing protein [Asanoa sp. WMMD1127]MDG4825690.1 methyltransferase domain-containing protein [Asanoa sp. WMMD1127]